MAVTQIASLADVKTYLRIPNPTGTSEDDATIQGMMDAATDVVERELGHIVAKTISGERHDGGSCELFLREIPVLYVQRVEEGWGYYNWELDAQTVNTQPALSLWSYSLDIPKEGLVTRRAPGNVMVPFVYGRDNIRVDYVVGRHEVPASAVLAFKELVAYWYQNSQLRTANAQASATSFGTPDAERANSRTGEETPYVGVPEGILLLLRPYGRRPIIG